MTTFFPICARAVLRLLLLALVAGYIQPGRTADAPTLEAELNPVEPGLILRSRALDHTLAMQESNKLRVAIPDAVTSDVELAASAEPLEAPLPPARPSIFEGREDYVRIALAVLMAAALAWRGIVRHQREAEMRKLCGGYLSDGTEVARFELPEWFAPKSANQGIESPLNLAGVSGAEVALETPLTQFFAQAPGRLARIQEVLKELNTSASVEDRQRTLREARDLVRELRDKATCWDLRPAWQMSSALELLLERISAKPRDFTPSVVRSIAAAVDVLLEVCAPGVRANLLIDPPCKILAVDDDPLCRRALKFALDKTGLASDLAETGEKAVELATANAYDVVFMDIQMPGIDGLTACSQIHETKKNPDVPVIFVTAFSDFSTRVQSRLKGGADLMAKPFLVLELTVRAVTFAMRKRLQAGKPAAEETVVSPALLVAQTETVTVQSPASGTAAAPAPSPIPRAPAEATAPIASVESLPVGGTEWSGDFFSTARDYLAATREIFEEVQEACSLTGVREPLGTLYLRVHAIATRAGEMKLPVAAHISSTLEGLLKRLYRNPNMVTASALSTISNALKLIDQLCVPGIEARLGNTPPVRILVVDDEPLARRAVMGALQLAFEQPESAHDGVKAAALAAQKKYDVIFTDVQMPVMDGFELCAEIRKGNLNLHTPVVFITNHTDMEVQDRAMEVGGNDFIGKPFLPIEITVKALTFAWGGRLRNALPEPASRRGPEAHSGTSTSLIAA